MMPSNGFIITFIHDMKQSEKILSPSENPFTLSIDSDGFFLKAMLGRINEHHNLAFLGSSIGAPVEIVR